MLAAEELEVGEVLVSVPRSALLSQHTSPIRALLQDGELGSDRQPSFAGGRSKGAGGMMKVGAGCWTGGCRSVRQRLGKGGSGYPVVPAGAWSRGGQEEEPVNSRTGGR